MARLLMVTLLCSALTGCELIADFDRSKIPDDSPGRDAGPQPDAAFFDSGAGDSGAGDAAVDDSGAGPDEDAGADADGG